MALRVVPSMAQSAKCPALQRARVKQHDVCLIVSAQREIVCNQLIRIAVLHSSLYDLCALRSALIDWNVKDV